MLAHRNLDCLCYDQCLSFAAERDWQNFSCARCELFDRHPVCREVVLLFATERREGARRVR